jgi:aminotransferase
MTRLNLELNGPERAINFAQGFPDFDTDPRIVEAAAKALRDGHNQYATTWGVAALRKAVAHKQSVAWGRQVDPDREVTVSCGATEAMIAAMLAAVDPGDEVVIFEPFYENYGPDCILSGAIPRYVALHPPDWTFDPDELRRAFSSKTRAIVINTPHNPTGKVYSRAELELIAELCIEHDAIAITDEIYEHLVYEGDHTSLATLPGMGDRTSDRRSRAPASGRRRGGARASGFLLCRAPRGLPGAAGRNRRRAPRMWLRGDGTQRGVLRDGGHRSMGVR